MRRKMKIMEWLIIAMILIALIGGIRQVTAKGTAKRQVKMKGVQYIPMECTAYCTGTIRCDGGPARTGVCAGASRYYGKTAAIYENVGGQPGEFLGYYEVLDTGGDYRIQNGTCLDVYLETEWECIQWGRKNVLVVMLDGVG